MITRAEFFQLVGISTLFGRYKPTAHDDPWDDPEWLAAWSTAPRHPITCAEGVEDSTVQIGPTERLLLRSIRQGTPISVRYFGGSNPGKVRLISPASLFTVEGFPATYLAAYCHRRCQPRHFRCDLLKLIA